MADRAEIGSQTNEEFCYRRMVIARHRHWQCEMILEIVVSGARFWICLLVKVAVLDWK